MSSQSTPAKLTYKTGLCLVVGGRFLGDFERISDRAGGEDQSEIFGSTM